MNEAKHASAPPGYKCSDCTMGEEACPVCYAAWWQAKHPNVSMVNVGDSELNALRAELAECKQRGNALWIAGDSWAQNGISEAAELMRALEAYRAARAQGENDAT